MSKTKNKDFNKKLLALVLPIAFQQFMLNLVSASDAIMLGAIGQNQLAAVSLAGQVQFILSLFLATATIGTNMFVAQYWGKKDISSVEKVFAIAMKFVIPIAAIFTFCTIIFPFEIMQIFTSDKVLIEYGSQYLMYANFSYLFCGISQVILCVMKNCDMTVKSSIISSSCVILDALMNMVLILGLFGFPKMAIVGAALSTTIARLIEVIWALIALSREGKVHLRWRYFVHLDKYLLHNYIKRTTPILGNELVWGVGFTMSSVIIGHLGNDATAANSIASITKNLVICICIGIGSGGSIIVGNELGAGNLARAKEYGRKLCHLAIISGIISGIVILLITPIILHFATLTEQAMMYLKWMLIICSYYVIGKSVNSTTIGGIFCAGGDSKFGFICDTIVMWGIIVPLGLICAFVLKMPVIAVYFILCLDEFLKIPAVYKHYKKYNWIKNLTVKEN